MLINKNTKMKDINNASVFIQAKDFLIGNGQSFFEGEAGGLTLAQLGEKQPTWYIPDILYGLKRLEHAAKQTEHYIYPVYPEADIISSPELEQVVLFHLPAAQDSNKPYAVLLAGGAYGAVCTMVEALPVAAKLNELGIHCFCLNYRTAKQETFNQGLMPKPLDDLAAALSFIGNNADKFGINPAYYFVGGFSAGGHTAAMWGTPHMGYSKYNLPKPALLMLAYPLITTEYIEDGPFKDYMLTGMFGSQATRKDEQLHNPALHIGDKYPDVYYVYSSDDTTVSPENALLMENALINSNIRYRIERATSGGHGFGLGTATPLDGWVERVLDFLQNSDT